MALGQSVNLIGQGVGPNTVNAVTFTMKEKPAIVLGNIGGSASAVVTVSVNGQLAGQATIQAGGVAFAFVLGGGYDLAVNAQAPEGNGAISSAAPLSVPYIPTGAQVTVSIGAVVGQPTGLTIAIPT